MRTLRSIGEVAEVVRAAASPDYRIVIGIAGAPGAGKSTAAAELVGALGSTAVVLPMDGFHLPGATLVELRRRDRMGAPDTFDVASLLATLVHVRRGYRDSERSVPAPGFDREIEEPVPGAIDISPEFSIVVVEGNYLFYDADGWERIGPLLDLTFFVELDTETRLQRLIARHERYGKSPEAAAAWALGPDESNAVLIEATASRADYRIALG